ncbi:hypothetical protein RRF57_012090 [Xylaria bambusicola]|uniref:Uncharacterized protein n=1 Tax=Xylaria bambusicola TaxID=326684 RepID=A0AAN7UZ25_9PEZI
MKTILYHRYSDDQFDNAPSLCMNLAMVLTSSCSGTGPCPTPCGSACLVYTGLTDVDYAKLSNILTA